MYVCLIVGVLIAFSAPEGMTGLGLTALQNALCVGVATLLTALAAWAVAQPGRLIPIASIALAMVLAVYMPPQEPAPGMAHAVICSSPLSLNLLFACTPTASNTETMSSFLV